MLQWTQKLGKNDRTKILKLESKVKKNEPELQQKKEEN